MDNPRPYDQKTASCTSCVCPTVVMMMKLYGSVGGTQDEASGHWTYPQARLGCRNV